MTADNAFRLYADGVLLGSGSNWPTTYSFSTDASEVLAVYAWNWGGPVGILLSTSAGLVTDSTWKCIDAHLVTSADWYKPDFNDMSWPNAVVFGYNGVSPWGTRPGISASAQWIWAPTPPHGSQPQKVYCRKKLGGSYINCSFASKCFSFRNSALLLLPSYSSDEQLHGHRM
jgi:hypothetical protein